MLFLTGLRLERAIQQGEVTVKKLIPMLLFALMFCMTIGAGPALAQADCPSGSVKLTGMVIVSPAGTSLAPMCRHTTTGQIIYQPHSLVFEGSTENGFETTFTVVDPTADRTMTFPDSTGTFMFSTLVTNAPEIANSVWGVSDGLVFEGSLDAFETTITATDATVDRTITLPDATMTLGNIRVSFRAVAVLDQIDGIAFIADRGYTVTRIDQIHITPETAGTVDIMPTKREGVEAPASGQPLLSAAFDGTATAETVQNGGLTATGADLILVAGDRLCVDYSGDVAGELLGSTITFVLAVT